FLLREILDHQRKNRAVRRRLVPEPFHIRLAERPLPRVRLPADLPRPHPMPSGLLGLRQPRDQPLHITQARHTARRYSRPAPLPAHNHGPTHRLNPACTYNSAASSSTADTNTTSAPAAASRQHPGLGRVTDARLKSV